MSMNLYFTTCKGNHFIDFPYQTNTDLTYDVLNATTKEKQLDLIKQDLITLVNEDDPDDVGWYNDMVARITTMLNDETLELTML